MYSGPCPDGIGGLRGRLPGIPARGTRGREAHDVRRRLELVLLLLLASCLLLLVSWLLLPLCLLWLLFVPLSAFAPTTRRQVAFACRYHDDRH
jgi:hypothetical protein